MSFRITKVGKPQAPKNRPLDTVIEFTEDAHEQRVEDGVDGKPDRPYTITHKKGTRIDCTEATAHHWVSRGKARRVQAAPVAPSLPLPPAA